MFAGHGPGAVIGLGAIAAVVAAAAANGQWAYLAVAVVTAVAGGASALDLYRRSLPARPAPAAAPGSVPSPGGTDLIAIIGPDGSLQHVSESTGESLALPTGRLFGVDVMRLVHPEDRGHLVGMVIEAEQRGESAVVRLRFVRGDKTWATFDVRALALPEAAAGEGGAIMIGRSVPDPGRKAPRLAAAA